MDSPRFPRQRNFPALPEGTSKEQGEEEGKWAEAEAEVTEVVAAAQASAQRSDSPDQAEPKWHTPWHHQLVVLIARTFRQSRHHILSKMHILFTALIILLCSLVWFQMPRNESSIIDRLGYVSFFDGYFATSCNAAKTMDCYTIFLLKI